MDFYHILPSHSSSTTYPKNNASLFTIPIQPPYILDENWEVALMNLTHSNCINTFVNDNISIYEKFEDYTVLRKHASPIEVTLSRPKSKKQYEIIAEVIKDLKEKSDGMLDFKLLLSREKEMNTLTWNVKTSDYYFIFSKKLMKILQLHTDTFTTWDMFYVKRLFDKAIDDDDIDDGLNFICVPFSYNRKKIVIKEGNEELKITDLINRFNNALNIEGKQFATLELLPDNSVKFSKLHDDNIAILLSQEFHEAMRHQHSGLFKPTSQSFLPYDLSYSFKRKYYVYLYEILSPRPFNFQLTDTVTLKRQQFLKEKTAIDYINDCINNERVNFKLEKDNTVQMTIARRHIGVTFDNDLRDILGFDKNTYEGKGVYKSSSPISLTRHIQYFYFYSDICDMVRVGDTKAPLLATIPFNAKECRLMTEKRFTLPMYVPVKKTYISQITVSINDDAGKLVPFHRDSITTLRLHFRKCKRS